MKLHVNLFGPFSLITSGGRDATPSSRKAKALLAMLALAPSGRRSRAWLQDRLWSDKEPRLGRASLRQELSGLRRHLDTFDLNLFDSQGDDIVLNLQDVVIDVHQSAPPAHHELLEGLDVDDPEFEYWLSEERAYWYERLSTKAKGAKVSREAEASGAVEDPLPRILPQISLQPFRSVGSDAESQEFVRGLDDELAWRFGAIVGAYKLIDYNLKQGQGADYLVTGSIRLTPHPQIMAQIIHLPDSSVAWSERYEAKSGEEAYLQERTARRIVEAIQQLLSDGQSLGLPDAHEVSPRAWDLFQKGWALEMRGGPRRLGPSLDLYRQAIEADETFTQARIALAFRLIDGIRNCWSNDPDSDLSEARKIASDVAEIAPSSLLSDALMAFVACAEGRFGDGEDIMEGVTHRAPRNPEMVSCLGAICEYSGKIEKAAKLHLHALTLTRFPPVWIRTNLAVVLLYIDVERALQVAGEVIANDPDNIRALMVKAVCLVRSGHIEEARVIGERIRTLEPGFSAEVWRSPSFFAKVELYREVSQSLSEAGL